MKESPLHRLKLALLIPLASIVGAAIVIGITGILLLVLAEAKHEILGVKEPYAVAAALILACAVLGGAAILARSKES